MIIGETKAYAILKHPESGQISFMPHAWLTPTEQDELRDFRSLRQYPPALPSNPIDATTDPTRVPSLFARR